MRTPNQLDPPNGDYVKYIEAIQAGKIRPQESLIVPAGAHSPTPVSTTPSAKTIPSRIDKRRGTAHEAILRGLAVFLVFCGIGSIAYGVLGDFEVFIPIGMFTLFAGFVFNMSLSK